MGILHKGESPMSCYALKWIAVVTMFLDHVGAVFGMPPLRVIGRIAFPIFAFLIANGFRYTGSRRKYACRLAVFAVLSKIPYDLLFGGGRITLCTFGRYLPHPQLDNVFFTLLVGLLFLMLRDALYRRFQGTAAVCLSLAALLACSGIAAYCSNDYGAVGVFTVALFGAFDVRRRQDRLPIAVGLLLLAGWNVFSKLLVAGCASLGFDPTSIPGMSLFFPSGKIRLFDLYQFARMAALPLLFAYNGERGIAKDSRFYKAVQYGFYAFYPLHFLLLWGLKYVRVL